MSDELTLSCWICPSDLKDALSIVIAKDEPVDLLKNVIKQRKRNEFRGIDARMLDLWKVSHTS
jgi:hypothetical protein